MLLLLFQRLFSKFHISLPGFKAMIGQSDSLNDDLDTDRFRALVSSRPDPA
jgi:hypothetical protein